MNIELPLSKNKNKKSVNSDLNKILGFEQIARQIPVSNINKIINAYQTFDKERNKCKKYSLTATINTIATNVLANPLTEIYNGDTEVTGTTARLSAIQKINPIYTYNCGYDIFDNHFLRVNTFKTGDTINNFIGVELSNVSSIQDTINNKLFEDNGWLYFINVGKINNNRMFTNKLPCEKIDLFPTRDLNQWLLTIKQKTIGIIV